MSDNVKRTKVSRSLATLVRVDSICTRYEDAWKANQRPGLATFLRFLSEIKGADQPDLFRGLFLLDCHYLKLGGETPDIDVYRQQFPEYSTLIRSLLNGSSNGSSNGHKLTVLDRPFELMCQKCGSRVKIYDPNLHETKCKDCETTIQIKVPGEKQRQAMPDKIGRYLIRARLGGGAFGHVYRAYDPHMKRDVAVKIPRSPGSWSEREEQLFEEEARATFDLEHEYIVETKSLEWEGKIPYIVSRYIKGSTLEHLIDKKELRRLTVDETIEIVRKIASALDYAHREHGIIHRDVKPSNILVNVKGKPYLSDFGLAYRQEEDGATSQSGNRIRCGTPLYMSPEQWDADKLDADELDGRSDVFSLGVVLVKMLSGKHPFVDDSVEKQKQVETAIKESEPQIDSKVDKHLRTICLKCLEKDRENRYTAAELIKNLQHYVDQEYEKIDGKQITLIDLICHWCRWCRRNWVVSILASGLMLTLVIAGFSVYQAWLNNLKFELMFHLNEIELEVVIAPPPRGPELVPIADLVETKVKTLEQLYEEHSRFLIEEGLPSRFPEVREDSAKIMGKFGSLAEEAIPVLEVMANDDPDPDVREEAQRALDMIRESLELRPATSPEDPIDDPPNLFLEGRMSRPDGMQFANRWIRCFNEKDAMLMLAVCNGDNDNNHYRFLKKG